MMDWILDHPWIGVPMFLVGVLVACLLLVGAIAAPIDCVSCNAQARAIGVPHRWSLLGGCQVEVQEGVWVPLSNWRFIEK